MVHRCDKDIDYPCGTGEYKCYINKNNKLLLKIDLTES